MFFSASGSSLEDVLHFFSGTTRIPVTGFDKKLVIECATSDRYPHASTCALTLRLPIGLSPEDLAYRLHAAVQGHDGFGIA